MKNLQEEFRNKVAQTIKDRRKTTKRVQVNASFNTAEYRKLVQACHAKGTSPSRLVKDLALHSIGNSPCETSVKLTKLGSGIQEVSQLLRLLYRDSNAWQKWQLKELRPALRRLAQLERSASKTLDHLRKQNAD